jgi:GxxExxY protein
MAPEIIEKELSYKIIQAAFEVHNQLGPGFLESIYEEAMRQELDYRGHRIKPQVRIPVHYKEKLVGEHILDMVVDDKIILELKALTAIAPIHK